MLASSAILPTFPYIVAIRRLMNLGQIFKSSKTAQRKDFDKEVEDKKAYQNDVKEMINKVSQRITFDEAVGDDIGKRYVFCTVLKYIYLNKDNLKPIIKARDINEKYKIFLMNNNVDELIDKIKGNINLNKLTSGGEYEMVDSFIPILYQILFVNKHKNGKTITFTITK